MTTDTSPALWFSNDCAAWLAALERYPAVIAAQGVNELAAVDEWYRLTLPRLIASRTPPYVTREELEQATRWKMKRGVWRERNRILVAGNKPAGVKRASTAAFDSIPDSRKPIALLAELAGVGPATASAVLAAFRPDLYPFFDELVAAQIPDLGSVAFTIPYYLKYAARLLERAATLDSACRRSAWTVQELSQALWANSGGKAAV